MGRKAVSYQQLDPLIDNTDHAERVKVTNCHLDGDWKSSEMEGGNEDWKECPRNRHMVNQGTKVSRTARTFCILPLSDSMAWLGKP